MGYATQTTPAKLSFMRTSKVIGIVVAGVALLAGVVTIAAFFMSDVPSFMDRFQAGSPETSLDGGAATDVSSSPTATSDPIAEEPLPTNAGTPTPAGEEEAEVEPAPRITYLVDLDPVEDYNDGAYDWDPGVISVNGDSYPRGFYDIDIYQRSSLTYDLSRDFREFTATAGVLDSAPTGSTVRIEVFVDENLAFSQDATLGEAVPIALDVTGALRLRLELTNIAPDAVRRTDAGFGNAALS